MEEFALNHCHRVKFLVLSQERSCIRYRCNEVNSSFICTVDEHGWQYWEDCVRDLWLLSVLMTVFLIEPVVCQGLQRNHWRRHCKWSRIFYRPFLTHNHDTVRT